MAMRSQVYEWDGSRDTPIAAAQAGQSVSIFIGGFGNNITKPAETTATQFVVIEDVGCDPTMYGASGATDTTGIVNGLRSYLQVRINTTDYFLDPDNIGNDGIPGSASPYPRTVAIQNTFTLYPDVYVLPGQTWDCLYKFYEGTPATAADPSQAFVKYTLYDGPDALIANKLLEMGISVNPGNVDWYKRTLISGAHHSA